MKTTSELLVEIDAVLAATDLSKEEKIDLLWRLTTVCWEVAFPEELTDLGRRQKWKELISEFPTSGRDHRGKLLDVLEWPATGAQPKWLV